MKLPHLVVLLVLACLVLPSLSCSTLGGGGTSVVRFEIDVKLITGSANACSKLDLGDTARVVSADAARELVDTAVTTCNIVSRPRIVVAEGAVASLTTKTKTEYVKDFDADAQPLMGTVESGVQISATPTSSQDDRSDVAFSIEVSGLREPMRLAVITLPGRAQSVTVELPEVETERVTTSFVIGADEAAILPVRPTAGTDAVRAVVLRVRRLE